MGREPAVAHQEAQAAPVRAVPVERPGRAVPVVLALLVALVRWVALPVPAASPRAKAWRIATGVVTYWQALVPTIRLTIVILNVDRTSPILQRMHHEGAFPSLRNFTSVLAMHLRATSNALTRRQ